MPKILHIETATQFCSVALSDGDQVIAFRESNEKNAHSRVITVMIDEIFREYNLQLSSIDAVAVSQGPGSYTGLRIGVSTAKGLCYALDKPLISVGTLQAMAFGMAEIYLKQNPGADNHLFCPMIDARRMEVYAALFDQHNRQIREIKAEIITERSFEEEFKKRTVVFGGDGADKCKTLLSVNGNAVFLNDFQPSTKYMVKLALEKFEKACFEDVAYFEPFYLKDFVAGIPRVKGLN